MNRGEKASRRPGGPLKFLTGWETGMTHSLRFQRAKRTLEAISDALRSAPFAPVPRHLLQKPQKPPKEPGKRPEQRREYEDYVARRIARSIYRLPVDAPRVVTESAVAASTTARQQSAPDGSSANAKPTQSKRVIRFNKVCARTSIEKWAKYHNFSRTVVFDWKAAGCRPSKGKVSKEKSDELWEAVLRDEKDSDS
jgi:hypothetical protein